MPASADLKSLRGKYAAARRWKKPEATALKRDIATQQIADYISAVLATAPPLTEDQRSRLRSLLARGVRA